MIYEIDIGLLVVLCFLTVFMCGYCVYCIYRLLRSSQMRILLRPTRVVFSHRNEGDSTEELRTVVAYRHPLTGDYCVRQSSLPRGYINALADSCASPDSGLSDEYEPMSDALLPALPAPRAQMREEQHKPGPGSAPALPDNSVNRTWNWNYKEYQI